MHIRHIAQCLGNIKQINAGCYYSDCSLLRNTEVMTLLIKRKYPSCIRGHQDLYLLQLIHKEKVI